MKDLFDYPELQPESVRKVLWSYGYCHDYEGCELLIEKLYDVGYTCEYGLDAVPYNLRKLRDVNEDIAHLTWLINNL